MRLPTVIEDYIPDVNLKPLFTYFPVITNILHYVVDCYLPVTENTSTVTYTLRSQSDTTQDGTTGPSPTGSWYRPYSDHYTKSLTTCPLLVFS